jgi:hypothetical protein
MVSPVGRRPGNGKALEDGMVRCGAESGHPTVAADRTIAALAVAMAALPSGARMTAIVARAA